MMLSSSSFLSSSLIGRRGIGTASMYSGNGSNFSFFSCSCSNMKKSKAYLQQHTKLFTNVLP